MKRFISCFLVLVIFTNCKNEVLVKPRAINQVEIEIVLQDSILNVRALELNNEKVIIATAKGETKTLDYNSVNFIEVFAMDTIYKPNFRSAEIVGNSIYTLGIASPALLYKDGKLVYKETHDKVFYDAMKFWNEQEGIAIGDTTDECLSIIITRDGGNTWKKLACDNLPKATENEGAFAASDTNIEIVGNKTWIGTTAGRIYYSEDKGATWDIIETPIVKNKDTEGIYSIDFYDELHGFAIGGDYTKPGDSTANKIRTSDGGKTWQLVAENQSPGYRSCVQYIPNRGGKELVAIGFKGIDYSKDSGNTWQHLSDEGFYTLRFLNDSVAYAAGSKRVSKLTFK